MKITSALQLLVRYNMIPMLKEIKTIKDKKKYLTFYRKIIRVAKKYDLINDKQAESLIKTKDFSIINKVLNKLKEDCDKIIAQKV